jgi:hypothetical protein
MEELRARTDELKDRADRGYQHVAGAENRIASLESENTRLREQNLRLEDENTRLASGSDTAVGIGYTLASGNLFAPMADFHRYTERLLARPIFTHEFANEAVWADLRKAFEDRVTEAINNTGGGE